MSLRPAETFFYGLFMDEELLRAKGLNPKNVELASVAGRTLRIGRRATLEPNPDGRVHGVLMSLAWAELQRLYSEPGVEEYRPEAVVAQPASGGLVAALCYTLPQLPSASERNPEYASKLRALAQKIGLPAEYVLRIE
jgi:AIG2-like family